MVLLTDSSPMVSRRVLYIGSSVPLETAAGLECIQGPLRERYPVDSESGIEGIDSHLSVTNSYIQLQYANDPDKVIQFPISTLTLCAAVRCVITVNGASGEKVATFVSLNDPQAGGSNSDKPSIFTAVTRRTKGRKVLECHGFICHSPQDAMELVKVTSIAGKNYKKNGPVKAPSQPQHQRGIQTNSNGSAIQDSSFTFGSETINRNSGTGSIPMENGVPNSINLSERPSMRLIPGEPITIEPGPEFYEPVSKQGYFYSSDKAEVKKFNIARLQKANEDKENNSELNMTQEHSHVSTSRQIPIVNGLNGYGHPPAPLHARPAQAYTQGPPPPIYIRMQRDTPPQPRPYFYGPPPQGPHPMMFARPRFFSPPPPRLRPPPFMVPPGAPPPMMAPPIFIRRPREPSGSRTNSVVSRDSRSSRSKSPKDTEDTEPKRMPNGDANSSSDDTVTLRPVTPPKDYSKPKSRGHHRSRRDEFEMRYVEPSPRGPYPYHEGPPINAPYPYDYHVYPPRHGGYAPFTMYNPHTRSRSLPPDPRYRSASPKKKKGKKHKKSKKKKQYQRYESRAYPQQPPPSDISTDSHAGYQSELPRSRPETTEPRSEYQFYPPRDFRRGDKQFMNERNFGKSIIEETRRSRDSKAYPTAYELNDAMARQRTGQDEEPDFNMY